MNTYLVNDGWDNATEKQFAVGLGSLDKWLDDYNKAVNADADYDDLAKTLKEGMYVYKSALASESINQIYQELCFELKMRAEARPERLLIPGGDHLLGAVRRMIEAEV